MRAATVPPPDDRPAPADPDLELTVLGSAIAYPTAASEVMAGLEPDDFADPRHEQMARVIVALLRADVAPEPMLVLDRVQRGLGVIPAQPGGWAILVHDAIRRAVTPASAGHHAAALIRVARRRRAYRFGLQLQELADLGSDATLEACLASALGDLGRLGARLAEVQHGRPVVTG